MTLLAPEPVRHPVRRLPLGHLWDDERRPGRRRRRTWSSLGVLLVVEHRLPGARHVRLQATRAELREGPVTTVRTEEPPPLTRGAAPTRDPDRRPRRPVRPAVQQEDDDPPLARPDARPRADASSSGRCATSRSRSSTASRWPSSGRTARARARCSRSWPGSSGRRRASVDVRGHVSGLLTLGAGFDKELSGRDNILLGGAFLGLDDARDPRAAAVDRRVRRHRRVHRRAAQDLFVGDARAARVRHRDLGRPGHPAARRGPRHRRCRRSARSPRRGSSRSSGRRRRSSW